MPTSNKGNFMMLTLKQRAALDVAKVAASAIAGAIFLNILVAYVAIDYIIRLYSLCNIPAVSHAARDASFTRPTQSIRKQVIEGEPTWPSLLNLHS